MNVFQLNKRNYLIYSIFVALFSIILYNKNEIIYLNRFFHDKIKQNPLLEPLLSSFSKEHNDSLYWGTYRSGLYYGLRTRTYPYHISAGILYSKIDKISNNMIALRHECNQQDEIDKYGWNIHNGRNFGIQEILDKKNKINLTTIFINPNSNHWITRLKLKSYKNKISNKNVKDTNISYYSFFFYIQLSCEDDSMDNICHNYYNNNNIFSLNKDDDGKIRSFNANINNSNISFIKSFNIKLNINNDQNESNKYNSEIYYYAPSRNKKISLLNIKEILPSILHKNKKNENKPFIQKLANKIENNSSLLIIQILLKLNSNRKEVVDIHYKEDIKNTQDKGSLDHTIKNYTQIFNTKFNSHFQLTAPYDNNISYTKFAQAAFSNVMGGIGFFYGHSLFHKNSKAGKNMNDNKKIKKNKPLFSGVPSRSFFPRGFVWDEGFHNLLIYNFDKEITMDILAHYFGIMSNNGYIAREQILGEEARKRVPSEFLYQDKTHANPPIFFFLLKKLAKDIIDKEGEDKKHSINFLKKILPYFEVWFDWFLQTQRPGQEKSKYLNNNYTVFQWKGRDKMNVNKLHARTLASGLDDYPRASLTSKNEYHLDLLCWMISICKILSSVYDDIIIPNSSKNEQEKNKLKHENYNNMIQNDFIKSLHNNHWDNKLNIFCDFGTHSEDGFIQKQIAVRCTNKIDHVDTSASIESLQKQTFECPKSHPYFLYPLSDGKGGYLILNKYIQGKTTKFQCVPRVGYVSLYPLFLKLLSPDSKEFGYSLDIISDKKKLWSPYGIRSLSKNDKFFYEQENGPGDLPYWRGPIWLNINYLILDSLYYYKHLHNHPQRIRCEKLYKKLRTNIVDNVYKVYKETGFLWEQYSTGDYVDNNLKHLDKFKNGGKGQRSHPFTGWTALVTNIMAEKYLD